jgi:hypothetical protein
MFMLRSAFGYEQVSNQVFGSTGAEIQVIMSSGAFYLYQRLVNTSESKTVAWKKHGGPLSEPKYHHHLPQQIATMPNFGRRVCARRFPRTMSVPEDPSSPPGREPILLLTNLFPHATSKYYFCRGGKGSSRTRCVSGRVEGEGSSGLKFVLVSPAPPNSCFPELCLVGVCWGVVLAPPKVRSMRGIML